MGTVEEGMGKREIACHVEESRVNWQETVESSVIR